MKRELKFDCFIWKVKVDIIQEKWLKWRVSIKEIRVWENLLKNVINIVIWCQDMVKKK